VNDLTPLEQDSVLAYIKEREALTAG